MLKKICSYLVMLLLSISIMSYESSAEIVNSIIARVNSHIITLRDVKIEHNINSKGKLLNKLVKEKKLLWEMIDEYLLLNEAMKVSKKELKEELRVKVDENIKKFENKFDAREYDKFLKELEITRDDIYLIFKNKAISRDFLKQKMSMKKIDSTVDENMLLVGNNSAMFSSEAMSYINELRNKADIIINVPDSD